MEQKVNDILDFNLVKIRHANDFDQISNGTRDS